VGVYKPVATGLGESAHRLDDARRLWEAAGRLGDLSRVAPQCFAAPLSPPAAARREGRRVDADLLRRGIEFWIDRCDVLLVEGAGGLMSPISETEIVADLAFDFGYPLVVVSANVLGTIHHTLSTVMAAATYRGGLALAGIVLNEPFPRRDDASVETNASELRSRTQVPILAELPWQCASAEGVDWAAVAKPRPGAWPGGPLKKETGSERTV
jgi:dethiobiotin synthetase